MKKENENFDEIDELDTVEIIDNVDDFDEEIDNDIESENEIDVDDVDDENQNVDDIIVDDIDDFELLYNLNTNKHKQEGKHKLKRDTLFKGKEDKKPFEYIEAEAIEPDSEYNDIVNFFRHASDCHDEYVEQNNLSKDVHNVLNEKTNIDFTQNRRKPNRETFNNYYNILLNELGFQYTKSEIFVELSYYFTDNIFNMFKLLDKVPATIIIKELTNKGYLKNIKGVNFL